MKYKYTPTPVFDKAGRIVKRPILEIEIGENGKKLKALGLIDSGSDSILMNIQYAKHFSIGLNPKDSVEIVGISGTKTLCYLSQITFKVDGFEKPMTFPVAFINSDSVDILLGPKGVFRRFSNKI